MSDEDRHDTPAESHAPTRDAAAAATSQGPEAGTAAGRTLPERIGEYRILGILGQGGMGVVYEAEQPSPRRRVALKVVRGSELVDDLRLRMFEREAATLARLDHPNIGRIYESGRTPEGRHYFAMELVRGPVLGEWLAGRSADPDRAEIELRLRLFRQICDAVHYAHQRGVIHRDLKPSNLIVAEAPDSESGSAPGPAARVRILDFGLARITEGDVGATQVTETGDIKGTLPYMAPEQARGESGAIDVRTDVYALGVILYELLTGQRPYAVEGASLLSAVRIICEQPPRPLGEAWRASARLDPDLATIVAMALEKEPDRRYASAAAFSDDIGRFLTSQPIQARPPSTMYQLRKLVARRKPLFATAAVALALLVVAAVGLAVLYLRSVEAERLARREAATAQRTSDFLVDLFEQANPEHTRGATLTAREVMDAGARRVRDELAGEPAMQARMMAALGRVYLSLGLLQEARQLNQESVALRREHLPAGDAEIAEGVHQLARVLDEQGEAREARTAYEEAIARYEALGARGADGLTDALGNLASMLGQTGDYAAADSSIDRALALVAARRPPDEARLLQLLDNQSTIRMNTGQPDSAIAILDRALLLSRRLHGDQHHETGNVLTNLSVAHGMAGQFDRATEYALEALAVYEAIYDDAHPKVTKGYANVAVGYAQQGKLDEARPYMERSLQALIKAYGPTHPEVAQGYSNLGFLEIQSGHPRRAIEHLRQAVSIHEQATTPNPAYALVLYHLATALSQVGELPEARGAIARAIAIDEKFRGAESADVADDLELAASIERGLGQEAEARRMEARMRSIREQLAKAAEAP